jgi:pimeloyl-ACP methyl ester carboxylesterase
MTTAIQFWRSPLLGDARYVELPAGRIDVFERGAGPALVFAHGWLANANLWRHVIDRLASDFRCIAIDMPLGAHRTPVRAGADLSPGGCAAIIAGVIDALELAGATLVGNDSGGAYSQIATAARPDLVGRLVLNACETRYDAFPPPPFDGLPLVAREANALAELLKALRDPQARLTEAAYGSLIKRPIPDEVFDTYVLPSNTDPMILRDVAAVMSATDSRELHAAGQVLAESFDKPVLFAWNVEDTVFPIANAERYAADLANAVVVRIEGSYAFTPEDRPDALAESIGAFSAG